MRKLGIYVQVPFCQTKCTYCNFHTGVVSGSRFAPYVEAVCREVREHRQLLMAAGVNWAGRLGRSDATPLQRASQTPGEVRAESVGQVHSQELLCHETVVDTVYIGGGTPSLLDSGHLQNILDAIRETFLTGSEGGRAAGQKSGGEPPHCKIAGESGGAGHAPGGPYNVEIEEVTLEADPETVDARKAEAWVATGINRVSFGLQSFSDKELVAAGRMHRRADIYRAVPILREAGIRNISFDLIAGLPHQTRESWQGSLQELAGLAPEHVSV
jgi:oxygen-independent coproporphyrinogen III oxidase